MSDLRVAGQWIPADKSLPGNPRCVLATDGECYYLACYSEKGTMDFLPGWNDARSDEGIDYVITHWMELPEVPE